MEKLAKLCSILFHPLILLNFGLFSVLRYHPYYVSKFYDTHFYTISMFIAVNTLVMPLLSLFLLKKFGFIDDFYISNPKQRLLPYGILVLLLGFTMYQLNKIELNGLPIIFMGASAVCLILNIIINTRYTISTHAIGAGGFIAMYAYLTMHLHVSSFNPFLIASILATGISLWSRLFLNAHTERQIYSGLALGFSVVYVSMLLF